MPEKLGILASLAFLPGYMPFKLHPLLLHFFFLCGLTFQRLAPANFVSAGLHSNFGGPVSTLPLFSMLYGFMADNTGSVLLAIPLGKVKLKMELVLKLKCVAAPGKLVYILQLNLQH